MPAHGFSDGNPCKSIKENAEWINDLLVDLKLKDVVVIGHSQGCLVALELNRILKRSLEALIFVAGPQQILVLLKTFSKSYSILKQPNILENVR